LRGCRTPAGMDDPRCQSIPDELIRQSQEKLRAERPLHILLASAPVEDLQGQPVLEPANDILRGKGHKIGPAGDAQDALNLALAQNGEKWFTAWKGKIDQAVKSHRDLRLDLVAIKGGPMCDRERDFLLSKYFYGLCTKFGEFDMKVCIVLLDSLVELQRWLDNPTMAADLLAEAWGLLKKVEAELTSVRASFERRSQAERNAIQLAEDRLGPESAKRDDVKNAQQRLAKRQAFLQEIDCDAYPEDASLVERDQERVFTATKEFNDHIRDMKEFQRQRARLEERARAQLVLEERLRACRDNLEGFSRMRSVDPGRVPRIKGLIEDLEKAAKDVDQQCEQENKADRREKASRRMEELRVETVVCIRDYMDAEKKTEQQLFEEVCAGVDDVPADKMASFASSLPSAPKFKDGEAIQMFQHVLETEGCSVIGKDVFHKFLRLFYQVVRATVITDALSIQGKVLRRLEVGEILERTHGAQQEETVGVKRMQCRSSKDGKTDAGWVTVAGNQGSAFLKPVSPLLESVKQMASLLGDAGGG